MKIRLAENQSIFDFVITNFGSIEPMFEFMEQNNIDSINTILKTGDVFEIDETLIDKNSVVEYFKNNDVIIATSDEKIVGDFNEDFNEDFNN